MTPNAIWTRRRRSPSPLYLATAAAVALWAVIGLGVWWLW